MKRSKRLYILLGILVVACAATFALSRYEERQEQIQNSDEVVLEVPEGTSSVEEVNEIMAVCPDWCKGLPLKAAGFESPFYKKD